MIAAVRPWDLRHLQQFLPSLPASEIDQSDSILTSPHRPSSIHDDDEGQPLTYDGLGDFSKIYNYLGTPATANVDSGLHAIPAKDDYASDGAIPQTSIPPRRQATASDFSDGMEGVEAMFDFDLSDLKTSSDSKVVDGSQKKDRKKARREERKAMPTVQRTAQSESECDSSLIRGTPARKASSHGMITRSISAKMQTDYVASNEQAIRAVAQAAARLKEGNDTPDTPCPTKSLQRIAQPSSTPFLVMSERPATVSSTHPVPTRSDISTLQRQSGPPYIVKTHTLFPAPSPPKQANDGPPYIVKNHNLIPSSIGPSWSNGKASNSAAQHTNPPRSANLVFSTPTIEPITLRTGEDRQFSLLFKMLQDFYDDRRHLVRPANLITHSSDPAGIHVFVDASNIFIGFVDQLKRVRNIHPNQRVPDVNLSFESLALLIERRRPVAKRVLVGSTPHIPAFDRAKAIGYEVSVLEKVMKARELTERQLYFNEFDARSGRKSRKRPPPHKIALEGSVLTPGGSETTAASQPQFAPVRLVEQGVDEVLHLKMMESMLDVETPGVMVLATGDAAQAEYSSGFMAMVERALRKGWQVELTSWKNNVSSLYRNKLWTDAWGDRFRIIELDTYAEELLDM